MTEGEERIRSGDQGSRHTDSEANCRTTQGKEERGVTPQHGVRLHTYTLTLTRRREKKRSLFGWGLNPRTESLSPQ